MVSFYGFYTTFTIIVSIASSISLGFLIKKYTTIADETCDVNQNKLNNNIHYNLHNLTIFLLITTIASSIFQTLGYYCTRNNKKMCARNFIMFIMVIIYIIQCLGSLIMAHIFSNNHECFSFYVSNNICLLISYISINIVFILQAFFVLIALITKLLCNEKKYNEFSNNYA